MTTRRVYQEPLLGEGGFRMVCVGEIGDSPENPGKLAAMTKRGYSREFPTDQSRRIKREIDWVPPALDRRLRAKLKREGISLRALTLTLWTEWLERPSSGGTDVD